VRYYLLKEVVYGQDGAVGESGLVERYNADLANDLGNLLARVRALLLRHLDGTVPAPQLEAADQNVVDVGSGLLAQVRILIEGLRFYAALEEIMQFVRLLNRYFNNEEPWQLAKDPEKKERLGTVLYNIVEGLRIVSVLLEPAMPQKAAEIRTSLGLGDSTLEAAAIWGLAPAGTQIPQEAPILFPKAELGEKGGEEEKAGGQKQKKEQRKEKKEEEAGQITIDEFARVQFKVAEVVEAEKVPNTDKLLKLTLSLGEEERTVVSGIAESYQPEDLPGKKLVLVANLKPAKLRGIVSEGMILAAHDEQGNLGLVELGEDMPPGSEVR
jgi:methionyl-tRNA synthetase